jgi:uncharacterized membrane protein (UPF0127 family)
VRLERIDDERGRTWSVEIPETHRERRRGLLGRESVEPGGAMLFPNARAVHTRGMAFPISVVFLDRTARVIGVERVQPGRLVVLRVRARHVLETAVDADVRVGDRFAYRPRRRAISRRWISDVPE